MKNKEERFNKLFEDYWSYIYDYKLDSNLEIDSDKPFVDKQWFEEQLDENARMIILLKGY